MIVKDFDDTQPEPDDKFRKAGYQAEKKMALYLRRAFTTSRDILVFNNLRFEHEGEAAQIDHLVLHPYGFIIIESKSVKGTLRINKQGEFIRSGRYGRRGMQSPIRQAELQRDLLQDFLVANYPNMLKRSMFKGDRFKILIAISDEGHIQGRNRPRELIKADGIPRMVRRTIFDYRRFASFAREHFLRERRLHSSRAPKFSYVEMQQLKEFLLKHDTARQVNSAIYSEPRVKQPTRSEPARPTRNSAPAKGRVRPPGNWVETAGLSGASAGLRDTKPVCVNCGSSNVNIVWNDEYKKYLFECDECRTNTSITVFCETCGGPARVSKSNLEFSKKCKQCETAQPYFRNSRWIDPGSR